MEWLLILVIIAFGIGYIIDTKHTNSHNWEE